MSSLRDPNLEEAVGTIDGVNDVFETLEAYHPGSVHVYINGLLTQRDSPEDGLTEMGGKQVRLHYVPRPGDTVHFYYFTGPPSPSPYPYPPEHVAAILLEPEHAGNIELVPCAEGAEEQGVTDSPQSAGTVHLVPEGVAAEDLVPVPLSAEEV
jgi:hypothetical protein